MHPDNDLKKEKVLKGRRNEFVRDCFLKVLAFKEVAADKERSRNRIGSVYKIVLPECMRKVHMCIF